MKIVELEANVFGCLMDNETANAGFVITEQGVVVIDALNTPTRGRALAAEIEERTDRPILFVINTHHHYDHVFGNQAFDAPVVAHCALAGQLSKAASRNLMPLAIAAWVSEHPEDHWLADELNLVYPSVIFQERLVLDLKPVRMVLQHVGGHTPDSCVVDMPEASVLFAGDLVFEGRVPFLRQAHIAETIDALDRVGHLEARTIVPGHGELCDGDYALRVRDYLVALRDEVGALIDLGWEKGDILDAEQLPRWWTEDRPDLMRANVERVYNELSAGAGL